MEKLSNSIAKGIADELKLDKDKTEVIAYGAFAVIQTVAAIVLVLIFGVLFGVGLEAFIISFTVSALRKYSGGVHASSPSMCNFIGTVISVGLAVIISKYKMYVTLDMILFIGVATFIASYLLVYRLAPVDSLAKPIRTETKKKRLKKASIIVLNIYIMIVIAVIILSLVTGTKAPFIYVLCIYTGVLWQVFTLTSLGHLTITKIDALFNKIFRVGGEKLK